MDLANAKKPKLTKKCHETQTNKNAMKPKLTKKKKQKKKNK